MYLIYPSEASFIGFGYGGLGTIGVGGQRNFFFPGTWAVV
jgi:hypothetical protein